MKAFAIFIGFLLTVVALFSSPAAAACPGDLDDVINSPIFDYEISYTNDNAGNPTDFFSDVQAQRVSDSLDAHHQRFIDLGFLDPFFNSDPSEVCCYDSSNIGGADFCQISLDTPFLRNETEACIRLVSGHELFHHIQYAYINNGSTSCGGCGGTWGKWSCEGTARMMQDQIFTDLDQDGGCITYLEEINDYLDNPNTILTSASYKAALFWKYLSEQLGTLAVEPERGSDVIEAFWGNTDPDSPDSFQVLRDTIQDYDPAMSMEEIFHDFTIANYTKEVDLSLVPDASKYFYIDETAAGQAVNLYDPVSRQTVAFSTVSLSSSSVNRWAARYFEVDVDPGQRCDVIGFRGEVTTPGTQVGWTFIGINAADQVTELHKSIGSSFYKAFIVDPTAPFVKLAAVVTGLNDDADFDYGFVREAFTAKNLDILRPTFTRQAYVGEHADPDRFLLRLMVTGPDLLTPDGTGTISVKGLSADQFTVFVEHGAVSKEAEILNAAYVGNQYWISVQAPVMNVSDGTFFNVRVCLCKSGDECMVQAVEENAIVYAKIIVNQVLVVDRSGSMSLPSAPATSKFEAAKVAASLFVDAAADDDKLGVVSFTGDNVEPNDDAKVEHPLDDVFGNRLAAQVAIGGISLGNMTSIGDGLEKGQDQLDALASPAPGSVDWIVLLSDGEENEDQCWSTAANCTPVGLGLAKDRFTGAGTGADTIIDAIAFGPQTDQALMQDIATTTDGDYFYVDTSEATTLSAVSMAGAQAGTSAVTASLVSPASLRLSNRLSENYLQVMERILGKQRLFSASGAVAAGETARVPMPLTETDVNKATLSINWADKGAVSEVRVYDPHGNLITNTDAQIFQTDTHKVYQFLKPIAAGTWEIRIGGKGDSQYLIVLSGIPRFRVQAHLYLSQVPGPFARLFGSKFLAGLPVTLLFSLTDRKGPVRDAVVVALVTAPDGTTKTIQLFDDGNHDDGDAGDGLFGNLYTMTNQSTSNGGVPDDQAEKDPGRSGSYVVIATAEGKSNNGEAFNRRLTRSFQVYEFEQEINPDPDKDGMPTRYEELYSCLDPAKPDADLDPDNDGLKSGEEYKLGTNPCDPDTDDGGEPDGSEVNRGADPLNPRDDCAPAPVDAEVLKSQGDEFPPHKPNTNAIRFPVHRLYDEIILFQGTDPRDLKEVARFDPRKTEVPGVFFDQGLVNGREYFYQLRAIGCDGKAMTRLGPIFSGIPTERRIPKGWVKINDGARFTPTLKVTLTFDKAPAEVLVSNYPDFRDAKWMKNPGEMPWTLLSMVTARQLDGTAPRRTVYARFRDEVGNDNPGVFSDTYHDSIGLTNGDLDGDKVPDDKDNCLETPNPNQEDRDKDGVGDVCDNCPDVYNPDQRDSNFDGIGDACSCRADVNNDGRVDEEDLKILASEFGDNECTAGCRADLNGDDDVDGSDLQILSEEFGRKNCFVPIN